MKILVIGSKGITDYKRLKRALDKVKEDYHIGLILQGGSREVDFMAKKYATEKDIPYMTYHAEWLKHGVDAEAIRNKAMVDICNIMVVFLEGESPLVEYALEYAKEHSKKIVYG